MRKIPTSNCLTAVGTVAFLMIAGQASAQSTPASSAPAAAGLTEQADPTTSADIVVTAQKRSERLKDVPISISVLSGRELDGSTAQGVKDVLSTVPGVSTTTALQGGTTQLTIRGVTGSSPLFGGASPIAYYLDGVPFSFVKNSVVPDADVYDLSQVEVLRGPQGTLYGVSALNGVVRVLTNDANPQAFDLKLRGTISGTKDGGTSFRTDGAINVPLVDDRLAIRLSGGYQDLGGWIDKAGDKDANRGNIKTFRVKVNAKPIDPLTVDLSAWLSRSHFGAPPFSFENGTSPYSLNEPQESRFDAYGAKIGYDFGGALLTSNTSYFNYENDNFLQQEVPNTRLETILKAKTFTEEVNLTSTSSGPWRWTIGGIYRHSKERQESYWPTVLARPLILAYDSESYAVFGEITRSFFDKRFELTAGGRYFEDHLVETEVSSFVAAGPAGVYGNNKFKAFSPRLVATYHPARDTTLYLSYSRGFRSGLSPSPAIRSADPTFPAIKPDKLNNYEFGIKGNLFENVVSFDAALYYIDWKNVQQILTVRVNGVDLGAVVNSKSASGLGSEISLTVRPVSNLSITGSFSWNDLNFDAAVTTGSGVVIFPKGARLNQSPKYIAGGSINYSAPLGDGYNIRGSGSINYTSTTQLRDIVANTLRIAPGDSLLTARASLSLDMPSKISATMFVDNLTNERASPLNNYLGLPSRDLRIRPRTVGLQLEYRY